MTRFLVVSLAVVLVACGSDSKKSSSGRGGNGGSADGAPTTLRFGGTAAADVESSGSGEGGASGASGLPMIDRIECNFYGEVLDLVDDEAGGFSGVAIGEVFRNLYSGEQRFEFSALIGGPATLSSLGEDRVTLRAFGDQAGAKPFWRELEVLEARATSANAYEGSWTCASLDLAEPGFPDVGYEAPGTWDLEFVREQ